MVKVKMCGIRRLEDIEYINSFKPDYIGFIFARSKREVNKEEAKKLSENLDRDIKKVGVFVNEDIGRLIEIADYVGLDIIQLHGDEDEDYIRQIPARYDIWKAVRVRDTKDVENAIFYDKLDRVDKILLDAYSQNQYGGLGETFDWDIIDKASLKDFILAGGLNPDNVQDAILRFSPYGVDVSSGVELGGYKDSKKIKKFIEKVRN